MDVITVLSPLPVDVVCLASVSFFFNFSQQRLVSFSVQVLHIFCQVYPYIFNVFDGIANTVLNFEVFVASTQKYN